MLGAMHRVGKKRPHTPGEGSPVTRTNLVSVDHQALRSDEASSQSLLKKQTGGHCPLKQVCQRETRRTVLDETRGLKGRDLNEAYILKGRSPQSSNDSRQSTETG